MEVPPMKTVVADPRVAATVDDAAGGTVAHQRVAGTAGSDEIVMPATVRNTGAAVTAEAAAGAATVTTPTAAAVAAAAAVTTSTAATSSAAAVAMSHGAGRKC